MRSRLGGLVVLALLVGACTGEADPAAAPATSAPPASGSRAPAGVRSSVSARLMVGVASADGVVTRVCKGGECTSAVAQPTRYLDVVDSGLMLFALSSRPQRASIEVTNAKGAVVASGAPRVETNSVAWSADLAPGRYRVVFTGTWRTTEISWVFGLRAAAKKR